jgi:hypothetical protein
MGEDGGRTKLWYAYLFFFGRLEKACLISKAAETWIGEMPELRTTLWTDGVHAIRT